MRSNWQCALGGVEVRWVVDGETVGRKENVGDLEMPLSLTWGLF